LIPVAATALIGCGDSPELGEVALAATAFANDKPAYDFFVSKGLKNFQSAGIVGNLDQESGVNPTVAQYGGGPGRGIAQWSVGGRWDTTPNGNVVWFAGTKGQSAWSLDLQLEFIWYELTTFGYGFSQLKATTNVTDATVVFMAKYEICGTCAQGQRVAYSQAVLNSYGAAPPYAATFVSQTWPYASAPPLTIKCGGAVPAKIVLRNTGASTWNGSTRLGTTQPRDRTSIFAGSDWLSPNRPAAVSGQVGPNADGTFSFSFHGPTGAACVPGTYKECFGVLQEGAAWFSDGAQGGPPDNQIEALIALVPADPAPPPPAQADKGGVKLASEARRPAPADAEVVQIDGGAAVGSNGLSHSTPGEGLQGGCGVAADGGYEGSLEGLLLGLVCAAFARRGMDRRRPARASARARAVLSS
jgi:hypothetical protein